MRRFGLFLLLSTGGCVGDLVELTPPKQDGSVAATDLAHSVLPGSDGGTTQSVKFDPDLQADLHMLGCAAAACHGGTQIPLLKDPALDAATKLSNYMNFTSRANAGENSPVLTKNLATSSVSHGGGKAFATNTDPVYQRWLAWINAGNPP